MTSALKEQPRVVITVARSMHPICHALGLLRNQSAVPLEQRCRMESRVIGVRNV